MFARLARSRNGWSIVTAQLFRSSPGGRGGGEGIPAAPNVPSSPRHEGRRAIARLRGSLPPPLVAYCIRHRPPDVSACSPRQNAGLKLRQCFELPDVSGDKLRHLEHANLALAIEYRSEIVVRVDLRSLFFILQTILLDVIPKFLG